MFVFKKVLVQRKKVAFFSLRHGFLFLLKKSFENREDDYFV